MNVRDSRVHNYPPREVWAANLRQHRQCEGSLSRRIGLWSGRELQLHRHRSYSAPTRWSS